MSGHESVPSDLLPSCWTARNKVLCRRQQRLVARETTHAQSRVFRRGKPVAETSTIPALVRACSPSISTKRQTPGDWGTQSQGTHRVSPAAERKLLSMFRSFSRVVTSKGTPRAGRLLG